MVQFLADHVFNSFWYNHIWLHCVCYR